MYARQTLTTELHLQPIKEFLMSKYGAAPGVSPHFVLAQGCPEMVELETRDPELKDDLETVTPPWLQARLSLHLVPEDTFSLWVLCQNTEHTPPSPSPLM